MGVGIRRKCAQLEGIGNIDELAIAACHPQDLSRALGYQVRIDGITKRDAITI